MVVLARARGSSTSLCQFHIVGRIHEYLSKCLVSYSSMMVPRRHNFIRKYPDLSKFSHIIHSCKEQELNCFIRLVPSSPFLSSHCDCDVTWSKWQVEILTYVLPENPRSLCSSQAYSQSARLNSDTPSPHICKSIIQGKNSA
jgi:hypothetical protein